MTCIIGFVCSKTKKVYMGGDSAGVSGYNIHIRSDEKVFKNGPFLMGFTSSFRMGQLLRYCFEPPQQTGEDDMEFMVKDFIPAIKKSFKDGGFMSSKDGCDAGGSFLVGYKGNLYDINTDFQVGKEYSNIITIGCGANVAIGAMHALEHLYPMERIKRSLEITTQLNCGVQPPFVIKEL